MRPGRAARPWLRLLCAAAVSLACGPVARGANWPGWRGDGSGVSAETNLPLHWTATEGLAWKATLPGEGNSSPIVWGDRVFLTASLEGGRKRLVLCLNAADGSPRWRRELAADRTPETYPKNGYASPTPVTDGQRVFAFFDSPGAVALDLDGNVLWTRDLGPFVNSYNLATSPVLCGERLIVVCDQDKDSFITALDAATGEPRWRTARANVRQYATPLVITVEGKPQVVVNGQPVIAYDPESGAELWRCGGMMPTPTPSAVFADGLVYVTSGRNGPSLAIDPRGRGDLTETHARPLAATGGPYVPSPLFCAGLLLPADNGVLRLLDAGGVAPLELRVPGHYTASPVAGDGKVYWASERGDVAVIRAEFNPKAPMPTLRLVTVNALGEKCYASPAIAGGRLYVRTDKHLFCIAGTDAPAAVTAAPPPVPAATVAQLEERYRAHPAPEGDDVAARIEAVEAMGRLGNADAVPLLLEAAQKDAHWDVSEAAAKALGQLGQPAVPALLTLLESKDWRPYLKVIAAEAVGRLGAREARPALEQGVAHSDPLVRVACLGALAQIAPQDDGTIPAALAAAGRALRDPDTAVRLAAVQALVTLQAQAGESRTAVAAEFLDLAASRNPTLARAALDAARVYGAAEETLMNDVLLYGEQRRDPVVHHLRAGPVRLKFQDGELRYLCVGEREIVRRVYFGVRDRNWDTVMPEFRRIEVQPAADGNGFRIHLAADCRNAVADFSWTGEIVGTPEGKITFTVNGQVNQDFHSPRTGICVLFGSDSLAGQAYETLDDAGQAQPAEFPRLVQRKLLAERFREIRYTLADGTAVRAGLAEGTFGMEDQRNFGDSSYKAFSGIAYAYPALKKGQKGGQAFVLEVAGAPPAATAAESATAADGQPVRVRIGAARPGRVLPRLLPLLGAAEKAPSFLDVTANLATLAAQAEVAFTFNPALHMPDDDTFMENATAVVDQLATLRSTAPKARVRVAPVTFNSPYPRPGPDPRNNGLFAGAWVVRMLACLAEAGADEAAFGLSPRVAGPLLAQLEPLAGRPVLETRLENVPPGPPPGPLPVCVLALAGKDGKGAVAFVANLTPAPQTVELTLAEGDGVETARVSLSLAPLAVNTMAVE